MDLATFLTEILISWRIPQSSPYYRTTDKPFIFDKCIFRTPTAGTLKYFYTIIQDMWAKVTNCGILKEMFRWIWLHISAFLEDYEIIGLLPTRIHTFHVGKSNWQLNYLRIPMVKALFISKIQTFQLELRSEKWPTLPNK